MKKLRGFGLLCLVLALCAILMVTTTEAEAATSDYYTYTVTDGKATITKCSTAISGEVTIPMTLDGYPVTAIAEKAFYRCHNITSVTITQNVTNIGYAAFSDCNNLKSVTLLNGVTTIEGSAFSWCVNLKSVTIPGSVTTVGHYAFYYCPKLEQVTYCGTAENWGKISIGSVNEGLKNATRIYHNWEEATCGTPMTCSLCGTTEGTATGLHTYGPWVEILAPTCTKVGTNAKTCGICGDEQHEDIPIIAHTYKDTVTPPDCTQKGFTVHVCSCGDTKVDTYVDALGHDHKAVVTEPTCTEKGFTTYTCACGDSYVDAYVDATGHSFGAWTTVKAATCTTDGLEKHVCACGETETRVVAALGHSGEQWFTAYAATCTTTGLKARICAACDITETAVIPALGHDYAEDVIAPTCTEEGFTTYSCKACSHSYVGSYVAALGHNWSDWSVTTEPTCTEEGEKVRTCPCGGEEKLAIDALGHTWNAWAVTTEPTCTVEGEETRICTCGAEDKQPIDALGHSWSDWSVTTEPTCTEEGEKVRTCPCGTEDKQPVEALGHTYESVITAPTCTEAGYTTHTCACGYSYTDATVEAMGHSWSGWVAITAPTCTKEGEEKHICTCGAEETRVVAMLPHSWSEWIQLTAPTCTTEGSKWHFCNCGVTEKVPVEMLPHCYVDGICTVCGTRNAELFDIDAARMILGNSLDFQFGVAKTKFTDVTGVYAVIEKSWANGTTTSVTIPATQWIDAGQYYAIVYNDLSAKEMADSFKVTIYSSAGCPLSYPKRDSVRNYVMRSLEGQNAKGRTMMVDMLNYGAAAQIYFGYNTADLANNQLTDAQRAYGTETATATINVRTEGTNYKGTRLILTSNIQMQVAFENLNETMYAVYSYTNYAGKTQSITVKGEDFIKVDGMYVIELSKLVYADARQTVTVQIFSADGQVLSTVNDSIESYINRSGATVPLYDTIIKFADSAKAYLK